GNASCLVGADPADIRRVLKRRPCRIQLKHEDVVRSNRLVESSKLRLKSIDCGEIDRCRPTGNVGRTAAVDRNTKRIVIANAAYICGVDKVACGSEFRNETIGKSTSVVALVRIRCRKI